MVSFVHVFWTRHTQFLLQKRAASTEDYGGQWALTAGHIQAGETAHQALLREIHEEIGVALSALNHFYQGARNEVGDGQPPVHHCVYHYIVTLPESVTFSCQAEEVLELKFIPAKDVLKDPRSYFGQELVKFYQPDLAYLKEFLSQKVPL